MGKNIAYGKFGKSIKFKRSNWKDGAGNNEPATFLSVLANSNPDDTFYIIGKSDLSRCDEEQKKYWFEHDNVIDVWEDFDNKKDDRVKYVYNKLKEDNVHIDYAIMNGGIVASINLPETFYKLDRKTRENTGEYAKPLMMFVNYAAPIIYYLNATNIKWINFHADARQHPLATKDLFNRPVITLGTKNITKEISRYTDYGNQDEFRVEDKMIYGKSELLCLADKEYLHKPKPAKGPRKYKVGMFFHKYKDKKRIENILEYVDQFGDDEIVMFGKWPEEMEERPEVFKGPKTFDEIQEVLPQIKYTLCYPIEKGDISAKWVESVRAGILPFLDQNYDPEKLLNEYYGFPKQLYVDSPEDMKNKIEKLENNEEAYNKVYDYLSTLISNLEKDVIDIVNGPKDYLENL